MKLRFKRRPKPADWWAVPGVVYPCNLKCGYSFMKAENGDWYYKSSDAHPQEWRRYGSWEQLDGDLDCSVSLRRQFDPGFVGSSN